VIWKGGDGEKERTNPKGEKATGRGDHPREGRSLGCFLVCLQEVRGFVADVGMIEGLEARKKR